ncbi:MAG TPA: hypothetical protein VFD88_02250 [Clostridia bacterium]|nr:hypothetical protein [Clostridia bacterium]
MPGRGKCLVSSVVVICGCLLMSSCGPTPQATSPKICDQAARAELLKSRLEPWVPSAPFTVAPASAAWLQVTVVPEAADGLFGSIAGIAELHSIPNDASPTTGPGVDGNPESKDPAIIVKKSLTWQELDLAQGAWQLYSVSDPGIEVVGCPKT